MLRKSFTVSIAALIISLLFITSCATVDPTGSAGPLTQTKASELKPGLLPHYFGKFFARNVSQLPDESSSRFEIWQGEPILKLDNQFGTGEVFGSGTNRGIGIRMRGALHFPTAGTYTFQALSNDGIKMFMGETLVLSDPVQHSDQLSEEGQVMIEKPGWYPVQIDYFQRKGTAALKLFWKTPGSSSMEIVPAETYGHFPPQ